MAVIKCKMCGGDLNIIEGQSVLECEYCGSMQTVPSADNEKKMSLFGRANRLRSTCDFDKAAGIYESIVTEFPDEAEGYWGLVLCKYGIEYVDDPATGKKIPTCHRSSYDSVMEDSNFEQAMENADAVALRVYREEAKQIESIRKGILEVSSKEEPYDIFICYKETDEKGERTLDSVLAQDIYGALTDKGYRVFFSRITLKGKLGEAYEPYIFAALNSAKVMLAIGTCYEYFNAVWVKNEWSRYLKICASDKSKHLIPCYKNLDAYDMPNEFKPLQAVDLGQMGAIQDLLWNMEKYIPLKKQAVVQETVVVGGNSKVESLLDRGNMALEDGDWAKADSFFEDVLNNDSKNAKAYVGKMLAAEKCRTMNAFIRRRKDYYSNATSEKKYILSKDAHIQEMVEKYSIPYYVDKNVIRKQYSFDLSYPSNVRDRKKQYADEESYWKNHKLLSRAEKFAAGTVAQSLEAQKKSLFDALNERIQKAEASEVEAKERVQAAYASHIVLADQNVEALYQEGLERREREYQRCLDAAKNEDSVAILADAQAFFENQKDYKDCAALAKHCASRIADIRAEEKRLADIAAREAAEEAERQRILAEKEAERQRVLAEEEAERQRVVALKLAKQRKAKMKKIAIVTTAVTVVVIAAILILTFIVIPSSKRSKAQDLMASGNYQGAYEVLNTMGDSQSKALLSEVNRHGEYRITQMKKPEGTVFTFEYNDHGHPIAMNTAGELYRTYAYTYYPSGNLQNAQVLSDEGELVLQLDFYDTDKSDIYIVPFSPNANVGVDYQFINHFDWLMFDGVKEKAFYRDGEKSYCVTYNEQGAPILLDYCDGNVMNVTVSGDTWTVTTDDGTYVLNVDEYGNYVKIEGGLSEYSYEYNYQGNTGIYDSRTNMSGSKVIYEDTFELDENLRPVKAVSKYKSDGSMKTKMTLDITWEWLDYDELAEKIAEKIAESVAEAESIEAELSAAYAEAEACLLAEDFDGAIAGFEALGDYNDSAQRVQEVIEARERFEKKKLEEANAVAYENAQKLVEEGKLGEAAITFGKLGDYKDSRNHSLELWNQVAKRDSVDAASTFSAVLYADGTVRKEGGKSSGWSTSKTMDWTNIVAVTATYNSPVGLRADGTVTYDNTWFDIVAIDAGSDHVVGLKMDGTVVASGENGKGQCDVSDWTDIVQVSAGSYTTAGLKADGTVVIAGKDFDVSGWSDIVQVSVAVDHILGLKSDGTVVAAGNNEKGLCDVSDWSDIVMIATGQFNSIGVKSNGTVVVVGGNTYDVLDAARWNNIVAVNVSASHAIGLKSDGTVVAVGSNAHGQCDVDWMTDVKLP